MFAGLTSKKRKRKQSLDPGDPPYAQYEHDHARMELDSHADTTALGDCCLVLQKTGRTVGVVGFGDSLGKLSGVPVVNAMQLKD